MRRLSTRLGLSVVTLAAAIAMSAIQIASASSTSPFWEKSGTTIFYNDGNVGIGTSAPGAKLHLKSGNTGWDQHIRLENATGSSYGSLLYDANGMKFKNNADTDSFWFRNKSNDTTMVITDRGNMGLGLATPRARLDIKSDNTGWDQHIRMENATGNSSGAIIYDANGMKFKNNADTDSFWFRNKANDTTAIITNGGNLGIGLAAPRARLDIKAGNSGWDQHVRMENGSGNSAGVILYDANGMKFRNFSDTDSYWFRDSANRSQLVIHASGNIGVGMESPGEKFDVAGNIRASGTVCSNGGCLGDVPALALRRDQDIVFSGFERSIKKLDMLIGTNDLRFFGNDDGVTDMFLAENGNLGIGTTNPSARLDVGGDVRVNGTLKAKEIMVQQNVYADHVFKPGYNLMPLGEVSAYIAANGHLPNVASEAEVLGKPVSVSETQAKLLEKIEELTLYAIEQEGRLDSQSSDIAELKAQNAALQSQVDQLIRSINAQ